MKTKQNIALVAILAFGISAAAVKAEDTASSASATEKSTYTLFQPTPSSEMREMNTDRIGQTSSAQTVNAGHFQLEADVANYGFKKSKANNGASVETRSIRVAPLQIRAGLTETLEMQVALDTYVNREISVAGASGTTSGMGDLRTGFKGTLASSENGRDFAIAVMPSIKWPTNRGGLGNNSIEGGIAFPMQAQVASTWNLGAQLGVDYNRNLSSTSRHAELTTALSVGRGINDEIDAFAGISSLKSYEKGGQWMASLNAGAGYSFSKDFRMDAGANFGMTEAADDVNPYIGAAVRF